MNNYLSALLLSLDENTHLNGHPHCARIIVENVKNKAGPFDAIKV